MAQDLSAKIKNKTMAQRDVNREWLRQARKDVLEGKTTLKEVAQEVLFDTVDGYQETHPVSLRQLRRYFADNNMRVYEVGRRDYKKDSMQEILQKVSESKEKDKVGITKVWMLFKNDGENYSRYQIESAFKQLSKTEEKETTSKVRCRYLVENVNGVWHGDIHYLIKPFMTKYIFTLMDDRSRYIVGYGIFDAKTAKNVKNVFQNVITTNGVKPLAFWSDNGLENVAKEMKDYLSENNIYQILTLPGNPQSNGKIERFWREMDKHIDGLGSWTQVERGIENFIEFYNYRLPHMGLEKNANGVNKTPAQVYLDDSLKATDINSATIRIDNKESITLADFIHLKDKQLE